MWIALRTSGAGGFAAMARSPRLCFTKLLEDPKGFGVVHFTLALAIFECCAPDGFQTVSVKQCFGALYCRWCVVLRLLGSHCWDCCDDERQPKQGHKSLQKEVSCGGPSCVWKTVSWGLSKFALGKKFTAGGIRRFIRSDCAQAKAR